MKPARFAARALFVYAKKIAARYVYADTPDETL